MVVFPPGYNREWIQRIQARIPGVEIKKFSTPAKAFNDIKDAEVEITFDPPWSQDLMSEEAKLELGML